MATLWDVVTGNSSLAVESGNTFFDHLTNQQGGDITVQVFNELEVQLMPDLEVELDGDLEVTLEPEQYSVELEPELEVEVC